MGHYPRPMLCMRACVDIPVSQQCRIAFQEFVLELLLGSWSHVRMSDWNKSRLHGPDHRAMQCPGESNLGSRLKEMCLMATCTGNGPTGMDGR